MAYSNMQGPSYIRSVRCFAVAHPVQDVLLMSLSNHETFQSLFRSAIAELYDAELQMIEDMPLMIRAASSTELKNALELHMAETKEHAARLEMIIESMGGPLLQKFSDPMRALLASIRLLIARTRSSAVLDAALVGAAQQVEHFVISSYGAARRLARMLGYSRATIVLGKSLKEEQETVSDLSQIGESVIMGEELDDAIQEEKVLA